MPRILFLVVILFQIGCVVGEEVPSSGTIEDGREIVHFGPGVHELSRIVLERPHALLEGDGPGVTVLKLREGVLARAPNPVIRNLTLVGSGSGTGLRLANTWSARIDNVEIENYGTGIKLELSKEGRERAGGKTLTMWPGALTEGNHWGSRVTLTDIRGVNITGRGDGIVLENQLKKTNKDNYWKATNEGKPGEFINATTIWGGHIAVQGRSVVIGDGVGSTKIVGTYLDISPNGGIVMQYGARGLTLVGVSLDLNSAARKASASRLKIPARARKTVQLIGASPPEFKIDED